MIDCCSSPRHLEAFPAWAHAIAAVVILLAVAGLFLLGWRWLGGARARHVFKNCNQASCQFCQDEDRDRRVREYAAQARAGRK